MSDTPPSSPSAAAPTPEPPGTGPTTAPPPATSATTRDVPAFGWSAYAERVNGRFAMLGFAAVLLIEALSRDTFLHWAGLVP
jgi:hypothetical protein